MDYGEIWWIISKLIQNTFLMLWNVKVFFYLERFANPFPVWIQCHGTVCRCRCREVAAGRWHWSHQVLRWSCGLAVTVGLVLKKPQETKSVPVVFFLGEDWFTFLSFIMIFIRIIYIYTYFITYIQAYYSSHIYIYRCMLFTMGEFVVEVGSACSKVRFLWSCDGGVFVPQGVIFQKNWKACSAVSKRRQLLGEYIDVRWFMLIYIHSFDLCWFMLIHLTYVDLCWFMLMYRSFWGMRKWILITHQIRFPFFNHSISTA